MYLHGVAVDRAHAGRRLAEAALAVVQLAVAARLHLLLEAGHKLAALHVLAGVRLDLAQQDLAVDHQVALNVLKLHNNRRAAPCRQAHVSVSALARHAS
jgi:hypothetical protein